MTDPNRMPTQTCKGCIHFHVTYDPRFPYGCRSLGFKSRRYPYHEVQAASGAPCQLRQALAVCAADGARRKPPG